MLRADQSTSEDEAEYDGSDDEYNEDDPDEEEGDIGDDDVHHRSASIAAAPTSSTAVTTACAPASLSVAGTLLSVSSQSTACAPASLSVAGTLLSVSSQSTHALSTAHGDKEEGRHAGRGGSPGGHLPVAATGSDGFPPPTVDAHTFSVSVPSPPVFTSPRRVRMPSFDDGSSLGSAPELLLPPPFMSMRELSPVSSRGEDEGEDDECASPLPVRRDAEGRLHRRRSYSPRTPRSAASWGLRSRFNSTSSAENITSPRLAYASGSALARNSSGGSGSSPGGISSTRHVRSAVADTALAASSSSAGTPPVAR
jgi:hypothetical protein